jgi:hypothetical protein
MAAARSRNSLLIQQVVRASGGTALGVRAALFQAEACGTRADRSAAASRTAVFNSFNPMSLRGVPEKRWLRLLHARVSSRRRRLRSRRWSPAPQG